MDGYHNLNWKQFKRQVEDEFQGEICEDAATEVETIENEDMAENEAMVKRMKLSLLQRISLM